jgi:hypothetical protein
VLEKSARGRVKANLAAALEVEESIMAAEVRRTKARVAIPEAAAVDAS